MEERHPELARHHRRQEHLRGDEEVGDQEREPDDRREEPGERHARDQHRDADNVEDVIDVEAVTRPLVMANARDRPVEAVAEPVEGQSRDDQTECGRPEARGPERGAGAGHRGQREEGEVVGGHLLWKPSCDPDEHALLERGEHGSVHAPVRG